MKMKTGSKVIRTKIYTVFIFFVIITENSINLRHRKWRGFSTFEYFWSKSNFSPQNKEKSQYYYIVLILIITKMKLV